MLLDGDDAGVNAAERSLPILLAADLHAKGCFLSGGLDPDDFVKAKGVEALRNEIESARELFSLVLARWLQGYRGSASEKVEIVTKTAPLLKSASSRQLAALYIEEIGRRLDVEITWVRKTLNEALAASVPPASMAEKARPPVASQGSGRDETLPTLIEAPVVLKLSDAPRDELELMALALRRPENFEELLEQKAFEMFSHAGLRKLAAIAQETYRQKPGDFAKLAASLATRIDSPGLLAGREMSDFGESAEDEERRLMTDYMAAVRQRFLKNQGKTLTNKLRDPADPEEREKALEQFMNIQRNRLSINREGRE